MFVRLAAADDPCIRKVLTQSRRSAAGHRSIIMNAKAEAPLANCEKRLQRPYEIKPVTLAGKNVNFAEVLGQPTNRSCIQDLPARYVALPSRVKTMPKFGFETI